MSAPIPHFALGRVISLQSQKEKRFRGSCKCLHHNWQWGFLFFNRSKITSESLALVARVTKHCSYCPRQDPINREKYGWGKQARRHREVLGLHSSGKAQENESSPSSTWILEWCHQLELHPSGSEVRGGFKGKAGGGWQEKAEWGVWAINQELEKVLSQSLSIKEHLKSKQCSGELPELH